MATILTATELTVYTSISASVGTIATRKLIETVEARLPMILNNYFTSDIIQIETTATFNATANTITLGTEHWDDYGFKANDNMFIYNSYRNDKYCIISSLADEVLTLTSAYSVVDESFGENDGALILFALVQWPEDVKMVAAEMCYFDYEVRKGIGIGKISPGIRSRSLGPLSESYSIDVDQFGYPNSILDKLDKYRIARLM